MSATPCFAVLNLISKISELRDKVETSNLTPQAFGASFLLKDESGEIYHCMVIPRKIFQDNVFVMKSKDEVKMSKKKIKTSSRIDKYL